MKSLQGLVPAQIGKTQEKISQMVLKNGDLLYNIIIIKIKKNQLQTNPT